MENGSEGQQGLEGVEQPKKAKTTKGQVDQAIRLEAVEGRKLAELLEETATFLQSRRFRGEEKAGIPERIEQLQFRAFSLRNRLGGGS